jgi:predicted NAD/FAD-binding protein
MRIAIIGSGIAGLTAAWRLAPHHDVTLFEANDQVGGHTATVDVEWQDQAYAIDTGFIVFNDWTYPNFIRLIDELGVAWQDSNMSFSLSCERSGLEYNGTSLNSLFAQRRNALNPRFLRMLLDILRFSKRAPELLAPALANDPATARLTLGEYLQRGRYSRAFREQYIVPMGRAIWSATEAQMLGFPARFFVDFFQRHGFLNIDERPVWRAIKGGSREYVRALLRQLRATVRTGTAIRRVDRTAQGVTLLTAQGDSSAHDYVVFACHGPQALALLASPSDSERAILAEFTCQPNKVTLHTDERMLPRNPLARAAWNYHLLAREQELLALTYDMNVLQSITAPVRFLVTLNHDADIDPRRILRQFEYEHPVYTPGAVQAQQRRREISGQNRSFYCGAWWRYGFHEDGVVSALWAVEDFARVTGDTGIAAWQGAGAQS